MYGLPVLLSCQIRSHLAILKPNHHADNLYDFHDIHDAANYILLSGPTYIETDAAITAALPASMVIWPDTGYTPKIHERL